jgi:hypothetical protein
MQLHGYDIAIAAIWTIWRRQPGSMLVPGHDIPMMIRDGRA